MKIIEEYTSFDLLTNSDCFIGVFLSHCFPADSKQNIQSKGCTGNPSIDELINFFKFNKSLHEKPKFFFIFRRRKISIG